METHDSLRRQLQHVTNIHSKFLTKWKEYYPNRMVRKLTTLGSALLVLRESWAHLYLVVNLHGNHFHVGIEIWFVSHWRGINKLCRET